MKRATVEEAIAFYSHKIGEVIGISEEFVIDQRLNDVFGEITENPDPMHNDKEWAEKSSFGGTIVYGFLQLSLVSKIWKEIGMPIYTSDESYTLNYGVDRVRFPAPLRVGEPARGTVRLLDVEQRDRDRVMWRYEVSIHQKGLEKPTMVAEILFAILFYNS